MTPRDFEEITGLYLSGLGYKVALTSLTNDYGADLFAEKGSERIVIQAKMYGGSSRKVNRRCIMELHGVKDYFDCTRAILSTDGILMPDALEVASKLKIEVINPLREEFVSASLMPRLSTKSLFDNIWTNYIIPLQGKVITRDDGSTNEIIRVDWAHIERISSTGKKSLIEIDIFKFVIQHLEKYGSITRDYINQNYEKRASSAIVLILSQVPLFKLTKRPLTLHYQTK